MVLESLSGLRVACMLANGLLTTRMVLAYYHSKVVMSMPVNLSKTSDKDMGTTSGQTIESSRDGGTRISNTDSASTLVPNQPQRSLVSGRWESESNGSLKQSVTILEAACKTI